MPEALGINVSRREAQSRLAVIGLSAVLAVLVGFSWHLANERIFQVDECQNVFVATLLAKGLADLFMTSVTLYVVPLMFLARDITHSADLFVAGRLVALAIFWTNIILLAAATGERLRSLRGLTVLTVAATLAPLWDYGFEVRHDNVLLTTLLVMWILLRVWNGGRASFFLVGALSVAAELVAFKAFAYTIPLTFCAVLGLTASPPQNGRARVPRLSATLAWCAGAAVAAIVFRIGYSAFGVWSLYARDLAGVFTLAGGADRFTPIATLLRVVHQSPLLVVITAIGCGQMAAGLRADRARIRRALGPEAILVLIALAALLMNPAPHPYNLVNFVPFLFLFGYRSLLLVEETQRPTPSAAFVVSMVVFVAHVGLFAVTTTRHLSMTNERQRSLMVAAEALTDPDRDLVYDGIGMVPTRRSINREWLIHGLLLKKLLSSPTSSVREMLRQKPASVLIQSYRTDWLAPEDHAFIQSRYIPLSDEIWVLGSTLPKGGGTFEVVHAGRYIVLQSTEPSQAVIEREPAGSAISVDGNPATDGIVHLTEGPHSIESPAEALATVAWIGPTLRQLPRVGPGDHRRLFVNWY